MALLKRGLASSARLSFALTMLMAEAACHGAMAHAIVVRTSPAQGGVGAADIGKVDVW